MEPIDAAPRPERNSDRRHREIREAAIGVFLANGYDGATMEDIAVRAGVSKQTVYKHFDDKQNLFAEIVLSTTDEMGRARRPHRRKTDRNLRSRQGPGVPCRVVSHGTHAAQECSVFVVS